jgi:hypothetical protein
MYIRIGIRYYNAFKTLQSVLNDSINASFFNASFYIAFEISTTQTERVSPASPVSPASASLIRILCARIYSKQTLRVSRVEKFEILN